MKSTARKSEVARLQLFLRIKHPSIDPAEITRELDLDPEYANQAGPAVSEQGVKKLHSESYWLAALKVATIAELTEWAAQARAASVRDPSKPTKILSPRLAQAAGPFDTQLALWLKKLESKIAFIKKMVDAGGTITMVVQRRDRDAPFVLGPGLARRLADLEIGLEID